MAQGTGLKATFAQLLSPSALCAATALSFPVAPAPSAQASSCDREVVVHIHMAAAEACWTYRGAATVFVGRFSHGQRIAAQMMGQASEYDPRSGRVVSFWRPRDPNVEGPGGFYFGDAEAPGALTFLAPANGTYRFGFSPCAMWGAPGMVKICAR